MRLTSCWGARMTEPLQMAAKTKIRVFAVWHVRVKEKKIRSWSSQRVSVFHILVSCIVQRRLWVWSTDVRIFCAFVNKYQGEIPSYKIAVLYMCMYINTMMVHYCYYMYNLMYACNPFWMRYSWIITNHCSSWSNVPSLCRGYLMGFDWFWLSTDTAIAHRFGMNHPQPHTDPSIVSSLVFSVFFPCGAAFSVMYFFVPRLPLEVGSRVMIPSWHVNPQIRVQI